MRSRRLWTSTWTDRVVAKRTNLLSSSLQIAPFSSSLRRYQEDKPASSTESEDVSSTPAEGRVRKQKTYSPSKTIFSGIQPTGIPHLGNYLGAMRQWKELQDQKADPDPRKRRNHSLYFSIVDLHSLTNLAPDSARHRAQLTRESYASLLAIGLDPKYSHIFVQSHNGGVHAELMWILSTVASTGYLSRMTQWKSKLGLGQEASLDDKAAREKLRLGLFSYPVLQAADILLYQTDLVPVGEDQIQHVEFTRSLARSFNSQFGVGVKNNNNNQTDPEVTTQANPRPRKPIFRIPSPLVSRPACRIMSLKDPTKKMSKSHADPNSRILITDGPDEIREKVKGAVTDSVQGGITYDPQSRPGVSNLIDILKNVTRSTDSCEDIALQLKDTSLGAFKSKVAEEIIREFDGIGDRFRQLMSGTEASDAMFLGLRGAAAKAGRTMEAVREAVGMLSKNRVLKQTRSSK